MVRCQVICIAVVVFAPMAKCPAQPTPIGACCHGSACTLQTEADCNKEGHTWLGAHTLCADCPALPRCSTAETLFTQNPADPLVESTAYTSEANPGFRSFESYANAAGAVTSVTWWGLDLRRVGAHFEECEESDNTFNIAFHRDGGGVPGSLVCEVLVVASRTPTGIRYHGAELNEYFAVLPTPCALPNGWISIVGHGDQTCWFLWISASSGDGVHACQGCRTLTQSNDLAVCLHGTTGGVRGACCVDADGACVDDIDIAKCSAPDQRFSANVLCADLSPTCGAPTGACCFELRACIVQTQSECAVVGGMWRGADAPCESCPCFVTCSPGASQENEVVCHDGYVDTTNGGCNASPTRATPVFFGDVVCGRTGVFTRGGDFVSDEDWYEIYAPSTTLVAARVSADGPIRVSILDAAAGCPGVVLDTRLASQPCQPLELDAAAFVPGPFWIVITAVGDGDASACGAAYVLRLPHPNGCARGDVRPDGAVDGDDIQAFIDCLLTGMTSTGDCVCADMDGRNGITTADVPGFVAALLAGE